MTIQTDIRIHDRDIAGFDYELVETDSWLTYNVNHSGKLAGQIALLGDTWSVLAADRFGRPNCIWRPLGTTNTMANAVARIHNHWADRR